MEAENPYDGLPEQLANRARELESVGLSPQQSIGLAVNELQSDADWDFDEIAEMLGVETTTLLRNRSKAKKEIENAARLLVLGGGGAATILSEYSPGRSYYPLHKYFIISDFFNTSEYDDAQKGESGVKIVEVRGGGGGYPTGNLEITTTSFASLDRLADQKYREAEFNDSAEASKWYSLLVDAGVDKDTLDKPGGKLPASHPDSVDHVNYQLRSLEPSESRNPRR